MKLKNLFKKLFKKKQAKQASATIVGITCAEYLSIHDALIAAYEAACDRQKSCDAKPSGYMKGLKEAIAIVDNFKPHVM